MGSGKTTVGRLLAARTGYRFVDCDDVILDQLDAVAGHLVAACGEEFRRRHPVAGQKPLHVRGGSVPRRPGIDDRNPAARPAEHERSAQTGGSAADDHHVIAG